MTDMPVTSSKEDLELAEMIINYSRRIAVKQYPYLEKAVYFLEPTATNEVCYIGADYSKLYYNPLDVIEKYKKHRNDISDSIVHSVLHCLLLHPSYKAGDTGLFGIAADASVCKMVDGGTGTFLPISLPRVFDIMYEYNIYTATDIYKKMMSQQYIKKILKYSANSLKKDDHRVWYKKPEDKIQNSTSMESGGKSNKTEQNKTAGSDSKSGNSTNVAGESVYSDEQLRELERNWRNMFADARRQCSCMYGSSGGNIFKNIDKPDRFSKFSYKEYIKKFAVSEIVQEDPDTAGMEMYDDMPVIEWNELSEKPNPSDIIIAIDMSGSCGGDIATNFLRQVYTLFDTMNISGSVNIHVLLFDVDIKKKFILRNKSDADKFISEYQLVGLGGTSFLDVFRYADDFPKNNAGKRLRGLFFFTDAYGDFPKTKRNYQTTFFVPEDGYKSDYDFVPKWIELVHYNDEDGVN